MDRAVDRGHVVAIALGSNLGDRQAALSFAIDRLHDILSDIAVSQPVETAPEVADGTSLDEQEQPYYLNAAVTGRTSLDVRALLEALLAIERDFGRERPYRGAPRTLDIDLILFNDAIVDDPLLQVPHPRFRTRFFVLGPLAEIGSGMRDPVTGATVGELLQRLLRDHTR